MLPAGGDKGPDRTRELSSQYKPTRELGGPEIEIEREVEMQEMRERKPMRNLD